MKSLQANRFILFFKDSEIIEKSSIIKFYKQIDKEVSLTSIHWRIHCLIKQKILFRVSRGRYSIKQTKTHQFIFERNIKQLHKILHLRFPLISFCFWETSFLQQISNIQIQKNIIIVETQRSEFIPTQIYLRGKGKQCILNPLRSDISDYVGMLEKPVFVLPFIEESPFHVVNSVRIPTVEKLLTDVFVYSDILEIKHQNFIEQLFQQVSNIHTINTKSLLRYSARRNKKLEISSLLKSVGIQH